MSVIVRADGSNYRCGDDVYLTRTVTNVPTGQTITNAWFTVKQRANNTDAEALVLKAITTTLVTGTGQISDAGASGTGVIRFDVTDTETAALRHAAAYFYAIKLRFSSGLHYFGENGTWTLDPQLIDAVV